MKMQDKMFVLSVRTFDKETGLGDLHELLKIFVDATYEPQASSLKKMQDIKISKIQVTDGYTTKKIINVGLVRDDYLNQIEKLVKAELEDGGRRTHITLNMSEFEALKPLFKESYWVDVDYDFDKSFITLHDFIQDVNKAVPVGISHSDTMLDFAYERDCSVKIRYKKTETNYDFEQRMESLKNGMIAESLRTEDKQQKLELKMKLQKQIDDLKEKMEALDD